MFGAPEPALSMSKGLDFETRETTSPRRDSCGKGEAPLVALITNLQPSTTQCGRASWEKQLTPSRRSTSTPCSASQRQPRCVAQGSTVSICSFLFHIPTLIRPTTTCGASPTNWPRTNLSPDLWLPPCGLLLAAVPPWGRRRSVVVFSFRFARP